MQRWWTKFVGMTGAVAIGLTALVGSGGGGDGDGAGVSNGRYSIDMNGAIIENASGAATIRRAELVLDGDVIATYNSGMVVQNAPLLARTVRRNAGQARLDFRIIEQTVTSATYMVTPAGSVAIVDTQTGNFTYRVLNRGSLNLPYTQVLRAGDAISITFSVP